MLIKWDDWAMLPGKKVQALFDVVISDQLTSNVLNFEVYGYSSDPGLKAPDVVGPDVTDTLLELSDPEDLDGDGVTNERRLRSGNRYFVRGLYDVQTDLEVKGSLDAAFSKMGKTAPGGDVDYRLTLTNTTGQMLNSMTLIDVLPSAGDLGITDLEARGSQFELKMMGPISLPAAWAGKVDVFYSTAANPERDELTRNTLYPDTAVVLTSPPDADSPVWLSENDVADWSQIRSFKLELKDGTTLIPGQAIELLWTMEAPQAFEVDVSLFDPDTDANLRAAWNSFAVATDHGQPVEPNAVGVYMEYDPSAPRVDKTINGKTQPLQLSGLNEEFTYQVQFHFGNLTGGWSSVLLKDEVNPLLKIANVELMDQNGNDVSGSGALNVDPAANTVTFVPNQVANSYEYLSDQTYTMIIRAKIREDVTSQDLNYYRGAGGIPNQGVLDLGGGNSIVSAIRYVKPPNPESNSSTPPSDPGPAPDPGQTPDPGPAPDPGQAPDPEPAPDSELTPDPGPEADPATVLVDKPGSGDISTVFPKTGEAHYMWNYVLGASFLVASFVSVQKTAQPLARANSPLKRRSECPGRKCNAGRSLCSSLHARNAAGYSR